MKETTLFIFSGLPGTGKSTLAREFARYLSATYVRIDTIEQGLRDICHMSQIEGQGYEMAHLVAKDSLQIGQDVVADSVNPWPLTRKAWMSVALAADAGYANIEVICSDEFEHRRRIESRRSDVPKLQLPTWDQVLARDYRPWEASRIVIDTAGKSVQDTLSELLTKLEI